MKKPHTLSKNICFLFTFLLSLSSSAKIIEIYDTKTQSSISMEALIQETPAAGMYILGEYHYTNEIQSAQAEFIHKKVQQESKATEFSVFWEFLNYTDQEKIDREFLKFQVNDINAEGFLDAALGRPDLNRSYAPIMDVIKNKKGVLRGINLPRNIKKKVTQGGITAIDSKYIPPSHYTGGRLYRERFYNIMSDHVPENLLKNYFTAQCLTDSIMAHQVSMYTKNTLNFVIAGSFHTDFYDATVVRLKALTHQELTTFKFVSTNEESPESINKYKSEDSVNGYYADYIVITK